MFWVWAGLLAIGTASLQLLLTDPMWLQHLRISPGDLQANPWNAAWLAIALLHAVVVSVAISRRRSEMRALTKGVLGRLQGIHWIVGLVVFVACAAHVTRYVNKSQFAAASYAAQLGLTAIFFAANVLNLALVVMSAPVERLRALGERLSGTGWERKLPLILAAWTFLDALPRLGRSRSGPAHP